jgi:hypothetical protein
MRINLKKNDVILFFLFCLLTLNSYNKYQSTINSHGIIVNYRTE